MADYVNKVYLKEVGNFGNIKFTGKVEDLISQLKQHIRDNGDFRFEIKKRKHPDEYGNTHFMQVDEWKPIPKEESF